MARDEKCSECNCWRPVGENQGDCRLNPLPVAKSGNDWCAQFKKSKQTTFVASGKIEGVKWKK